MSEELREEMDLLSAMFPDECYLAGQRLVFGPVDGLEMELDLPLDFPVGAPRLLSVTGASAVGLTTLLSRLFHSDTGSCLFEFIQSARDLAATEADAAQSVPPTSAQSQSPLPATEGASHGQRGDEDNHNPEEESMVEHEEAALLRMQLPPSLEAAGFARYGECCFVHEHGCEVEITRDAAGRGTVVVATAAGIGAEDLAEFVAMELSVRRYAEFGVQLLEGVRMMRHMASEAAEAGDEGEGGGVGVGSAATGTQEDFDARCHAKLPSPEEVRAHARWVDESLSINAERQLHIYTWGDALMKKTALRARRSQFDVNAKPLNGRGGGADTRRNALQDGRIRLNVAASLSDDRGMTMLVQTLRKIEAEDLHCISVFCSKGRHRSVSMAVLLKMAYYPQATIEHLTIK